MPSNSVTYKNRSDSDLVFIGTKFDEIYKFFLNTISNDYRIKSLFEKDEQVAQDMLKTWLLKAIAYFSGYAEDLEFNFDEENNIFEIDLTLTEKVILGDLMVLVWMEWNINNITQMNLSLQDSDFNRHSESQNLSAKEEAADKWREKVYHRISEYTSKDMPISKWATGDIE